jgi:DNA-binding NtrC family response regulator
MSTSKAALHQRRSPTALPTVLVVDAGVAFGLSLNKSLREYGYDVRLATSAEHAVRCVHARHFDFMIVHEEGDGRGRAAVVAVRGLIAGLPCAVIGSKGRTEGEQEIIAHAGPVTVLGKPLDLMQLIARIEQALKKGPPEHMVCEMASSDQPTRRDLPAVTSDDRPARQQGRALSPTRRVPAVMEDPPEVARSRRPTVETRAIDAGVYSIRNVGRDVVELFDLH